MLEMRDIRKSFGGNTVLKGVNFSVREGEIHALLGENGAGKSTLMNILGGVLPADKGEILFDGAPLRLSSPKDAIKCGIAFIHQELNLINDLSIYENLFVCEEIIGKLFLKKQQMKDRARQVLKSMGVEISPCEKVAALDASYKQIVEIARALLFNARIIIMDEPTTSLSGSEIERVFTIMRALKSKGVSVIFISHKLKEVTTICDRYTVLRDGEIAGTGLIADVNEKALACLMIGHDVVSGRRSGQAVKDKELLKVTDLTKQPYFKNVSFSLCAGEVLGFTGLLGDGRSQLFGTIFGCFRPDRGEIRLEGKPIKPRGTHHAARLGIGYVPSNRKENGVIKDLSILHNLSIVAYRKFRRFGLISRRRETENFDKLVEELHIKVHNRSDVITSLSGGNQQKVVLAKWLSAQSKVLIFDNPTQGVDVGAKEDIYAIIQSLAQAGHGIVVLSSESKEILRLCSRAFVMYHGEIRGELNNDELNDKNIMLLSTGSVILRSEETK